MNLNTDNYAVRVIIGALVAMWADFLAPVEGIPGIIIGIAAVIVVLSVIDARKARTERLRRIAQSWARRNGHI